MKSSQPPVFATWLLKHLCPGQYSEALAGDLVEEYRRGRSESWYWRQVLVAIVGHNRGGKNMTANSKWRNLVALTAVAVLVGSLVGNWIQYRSLNQKKQEITIEQRRAKNEELRRIQSELAYVNWAVPLLTQKLEGSEVRLRTAEESSRPETANALRNSATFLQKQIEDQVKKKTVLETRQKELESKLRS
jgi:hypothetical protein